MLSKVFRKQDAKAIGRVLVEPYIEGYPVRREFNYPYAQISKK